MCSQAVEEVEPDGRRMGGGEDGDSWADLGPWGEEATDPGEAGEEQQSWRWKRKLCLGVGVRLGWQLNLGLGGSGCFEQG